MKSMAHQICEEIFNFLEECNIPNILEKSYDENLADIMLSVFITLEEYFENIGDYKT